MKTKPSRNSWPNERAARSAAARTGGVYDISASVTAEMRKVRESRRKAVAVETATSRNPALA